MNDVMTSEMACIAALHTLNSIPKKKKKCKNLGKNAKKCKKSLKKSESLNNNK
jgi:hypothetical protein